MIVISLFQKILLELFVIKELVERRPTRARRSIAVRWWNSSTFKYASHKINTNKRGIEWLYEFAGVTPRWQITPRFAKGE